MIEKDFINELDGKGYVFLHDYEDDPKFNEFLRDGKLMPLGSIGLERGNDDYFYTLDGDPYKLAKRFVSNSSNIGKTVDIPGFDERDGYTDETTELILKHAAMLYDARVVWCDEVVDIDGNVTKDERIASWGLSWAHGAMSIGFWHGDEKLARCAAAIFIHLWRYHGVEASMAMNLGYSHAYTSSKR